MFRLLDLHKGEENKQKVLENVKDNISFSGSNLWILMAAILVASVGLNVNSTAVVIGAMLISPLMGPIVGAGFALGVFDFELLKKSLKNLLIATIASLLVSTIYFYISPFKEAQSELLARTSPNIYDVLIAFFGGLAGVIAITRVEKGNPIPGVAIATALMPPLCTAGFGLATGNFKFFFGALFLYTINCVFIGISTFLIVKFLKYPSVKFVDLKERKRVQNLITLLSLLVLLPSIYFAYSLYKEQEFRIKADQFIEKEFIEKGNTLVYKKINFLSNPRKIELAFLKRNFTQDEIKKMNQSLSEIGLNNTELIIKANNYQNLEVLKDDILNEINKNSERDKELLALKSQTSSLEDNMQLLKEAQVLFPNINAINVSELSFAQGDSLVEKPVLIYQASENLTDEDQIKLKNWIEKRLNKSKVEVYK